MADDLDRRTSCVERTRPWVWTPWTRRQDATTNAHQPWTKPCEDPRCALGTMRPQDPDVRAQERRGSVGLGHATQRLAEVRRRRRMRLGASQERGCVVRDCTVPATQGLLPFASFSPSIYTFSQTLVLLRSDITWTPPWSRVISSHSLFSLFGTQPDAAAQLRLPLLDSDLPALDLRLARLSQSTCASSPSGTTCDCDHTCDSLGGLAWRYRRWTRARISRASLCDPL